jgi:hypothetical protein
MHPIARRLFFKNKQVIGKDLFGNPVEIKGEFLNCFGRNTVFLALSIWVILILGVAITKP